MRTTSIILFLFGLVSLLILMNGVANWLEAQPSPPDQKFAVVDRYDNRCDVIRYTPDNSSRYFYLLDCSSK